MKSEGAIMTGTDELIDVERLGETLVLTPLRDLRELDYEAIEREQRELLLLLRAAPSICNVVMDFAHTDYFGSSALSLLVRLWRVVQGRGGRMALCHVSAHESEILQVTRLASILPAHASRDEAIAAVSD
jgi:stage II sporulation protein AA (anti-sigma F factor antagonist)